MVYKNISNSTKKFYGVAFKPGEVKEVPGYVNDKHMIVSKLPETKSDAKPVKPTKSANLDSKSAKVEETETEIEIKEEQNNG